MSVFSVDVILSFVISVCDDSVFNGFMSSRTSGGFRVSMINLSDWLHKSAGGVDVVQSHSKACGVDGSEIGKVSSDLPRPPTVVAVNSGYNKTPPTKSGTCPPPLGDVGNAGSPSLWLRNIVRRPFLSVCFVVNTVPTGIGRF